MIVHKAEIQDGRPGAKVEFFNLLSDTRPAAAPGPCRWPAGGETVAVAVAWHSLVPGAGIVFVRISAAVLQCRVLIDGSTEH